MTETTQATAAASANGAGPAPSPESPCEDCVTGGERGLAALAIVLGLFIVAVGIDMLTGGKLSGMIPVRGEQ